MADEIDRASALEEWHREAAISMRKPVERHYGYCLNCRKPSVPPFCDPDCQKDYKIFEEAQARNGKT